MKQNPELPCPTDEVVPTSWCWVIQPVGGQNPNPEPVPKQSENGRGNETDKKARQHQPIFVDLLEGGAKDRDDQREPENQIHDATGYRLQYCLLPIRLRRR